jgi:hypothetical protein
MLKFLHYPLLDSQRHPYFPPFDLILKSLHYPFMPPYFHLGGWGKVSIYYSLPLAVVSALYWIFPFARRQTRAISFAAMIGHLYLSFIAPPWPWYVPSLTFLSIIVISMVALQLFDGIAKLKHKLSASFYHALTGAVYLFFCLLPLAGFLLTSASAYQLRIQQEVIENGNRKQVGIWLKENARSNKDTVLLEPLGYIGFYSGLKMYDVPGLSSPEVVAVRRKLGADMNHFSKMIPMLQPDWLVLNSYKFLPGRDYLRKDQTFVVYKRIGDQSIEPR